MMTMGSRGSADGDADGGGAAGMSWSVPALRRDHPGPPAAGIRAAGTPVCWGGGPCGGGVDRRGGPRAVAADGHRRVEWDAIDTTENSAASVSVARFPPAAPAAPAHRLRYQLVPLENTIPV